MTKIIVLIMDTNGIENFQISNRFESIKGIDKHRCKCSEGLNIHIKETYKYSFTVFILPDYLFEGKF